MTPMFATRATLKTMIRDVMYVESALGWDTLHDVHEYVNSDRTYRLPAYTTFIVVSEEGHCYRLTLSTMVDDNGEYTVRVSEFSSQRSFKMRASGVCTVDAWPTLQEFDTPRHVALPFQLTASRAAELLPVLRA